MPLEDAGRCGGYQFGGRRVAALPEIEAIGRHGLVVLGLVAQEGDLVARFVEGQAFVASAAGHQRLHRPVGEEARKGSVLRGVGRRRAVRQPDPLRVDGVLRDFGDRRLLAGGQLAENEVGTGVLPLLAGCASAAALRRLACRRRRASASACRGRCSAAGPAPAATRAARARRSAATACAANALVVGQPGRRLRCHAEAADLLDGRHLAAGQGHDAEAGPRFARRRGGRRAFTPGALSGGRGLGARCGLRFLLGIRLALSDGEDEERVVRRERRPGASRVFELLPRLHVPDDEFAVLGLRRGRVREPLAVVRQARALDCPPVVDDVVGERPLFDCRDGRRRRRGLLRRRFLSGRFLRGRLLPGRCLGRHRPLEYDKAENDHCEQSGKLPMMHEASSRGNRCGIVTSDLARNRIKFRGRCQSENFVSRRTSVSRRTLSVEDLLIHFVRSGMRTARRMRAFRAGQRGSLKHVSRPQGVVDKSSRLPIRSSRACSNNRKASSFCPRPMCT